MILLQIFGWLIGFLITLVVGSLLVNLTGVSHNMGCMGALFIFGILATLILNFL